MDQLVHFVKIEGIYNTHVYVYKFLIKIPTKLTARQTMCRRIDAAGRSTTDSLAPRYLKT